MADQLPPVDDFSAAFDNLTIVEDKGAAAPAAGEGEDAGAAGAAADAGGDAGADGAGTDAGADGVVAPAAGEAAVIAEPEAGADPAGGAAAPAPEGAAPAKAPAAVEPAAPPPPPAGVVDTDAVLNEIANRVKAQPAVAPAEVEEPIYNEAEQAILTNFEKEWPEVHAAMPLIQRTFGRSLLAYAFKEIRKEFDPIKEMVESMALRTHVSDIKGEIGEYTDQERDAIVAWVDEQPDYLQSAYKGVIEDGTAKQIGDLVNRFREATGRVVTPPNQDPPGGDTELSDAAKKAAAALAPVGSKRSVVQQTDDPNDFDGAFTKFAGQTEKV